MQDSQQRQGNGQDSGGGGGEQQWLGGQIRMGRQREGNGAGGTQWPASSSGLSPSHGPMELRASELPDLPPAHAPQHQQTTGLGGGHPVPHPSVHSLVVPTLSRRSRHLSSSLGHRCLLALMGEQGWGAVLRETSRSGTPCGGIGCIRPSRAPRDGDADVQRQEPGPKSVGRALCPRASKPSAPEHRPLPGPAAALYPSLGQPIGPPRAWG